MICIALAFAMMFAVPVHASEATTWSSSYILAYDSALLKVSGTTFEVRFNITGAGIMDEIGVSEIRVQSSWTGTGDWNTMKVFYPEDYPDMVAENIYAHVGNVLYTGTTGYHYRAIVTFYAKKGNGAGYITDYAEVIRVP